MKYIALIFFLVGCTDLTWRLNEANDFFKPVGNNDRNFTQGLQISATKTDGTNSSEWYARQIFYTPSHKRLSDPISTERPYAGALLGGKTTTDVDASGTKNIRSYELGIVGPYAFAEQAQRVVHTLIGQDYPLGWDHQLGTEPVFQYRVATESAGNLVVKRGYDIGNMFTQYWFGARVQTGDVNSPGPMWPRIKRQPNAVFFAEILTRLVARNIFLDGNTFRSSRSVDKYPAVIEGRLGVKYGPVSYTFIKMSPEFVSGEAASFGEVEVTW